jgi:putative ABC transport system permease protein
MMVFPRLFIWFSFRQIHSHRVHAVIVLLGIALGSAVFTSVRLSVSASLAAYSKSMDVLSGQSDMVLIRPGGRVPDEIVASLFSNPKVQAIAPFSSTYVRPLRGSQEPFLLVGIDPISDRRFRSWQTASDNGQPRRHWMQLIIRPNTLLVGSQLAKELHLKDDDVLQLEHAHQKGDFHVLGHLEFDSVALAEGGRIAVTDIATFQEFTDSIGQVDRIDLKFASQPSPSELTRLKKSFASGMRVALPKSERDNGRNMIKAYEINLSVLSFASLFWECIWYTVWWD